MQVIQDIKLDINDDSFRKVCVSVKQADNGRLERVRITDRDNFIVVPSSATVSLRVLKSDGTSVDSPCTVNADGTVDVPLSAQVTAVAGYAKADISIAHDGYVVSTATFMIRVGAVPVGVDIISVNEFTQLNALIESASQYETRIGDLEGEVGDLSDLETKDKTSLVAAINEAAQSGGSGTGLTENIKVALLDCFNNVAWTNGQGNNYINNLKNALDENYVAVTGVTLNKDTLELSVGDEETIVATVMPSNATNKAVNYSSSNMSVATVGQDGKVTAVTQGMATITCITEDKGHIATCSVAVDVVPITYTITNNLSNVSNSNSATSILEGSAYTATLVAMSGRIIDTVSVTMSGIDITGSAYSDGTISIAQVTGDIIITASAIQEGVYNDPSKWTAGYINSDGTINTTSTNGVMYYDKFIPVSGVDTIFLVIDDADWTTKWGAVGFYSSENVSSFISRIAFNNSSTASGLTGNANFQAFPGVALVAVPEGASYAIVSARNLTDYYTEASVQTIIPDVILSDELNNELWRPGYLVAVSNGSRINTSSTSGEMLNKCAVKVKPNTTYRLSNSDSSWTSAWIGYYLISESYTYDSRLTGNANNGYIDITTGSNTGWLWISSRNMTDYYSTAILVEVE